MAKQSSDNKPELERRASPEITEMVWLRTTELDVSLKDMGVAFAKNFGQYEQDNKAETEVKRPNLDATEEFVASSLQTESVVSAPELDQSVVYEAKPIEKAVVELDGVQKPKLTADGLSEQEDRERRTQQALKDLEGIDA